MTTTVEPRRGLLQVGPGLYLDPVERADLKPGTRTWMLLNDAGMKRLGLTPAQYDTVFRLAESGFIIVANWAPRLWAIDMNSWQAHLDRTSEDPYFWDDEKRMARYRATYRG